MEEKGLVKTYQDAVLNRTATVLLVEDDLSILDGMADLLHIFDLGYEIHVLKATNGQEGLEIMGQVAPDLIISDIMMPRLNGFEFLARVRENPAWVHIPFIFLTARGRRQDIMEGRRSGAELYITKPFVSSELLELVKTQLDRAFQLQKAHQDQLGALKRNLLQLLNHEFRTPLTYVTAYYDMLADSIVSFEDPTTLHEYLRGIQVGCIRLTNLIEDLILIMDIRTGRTAELVERQARRLDAIGALLRRRGEAFTRRARDAGVTITYAIASDLPPVYGEPGLLADAIDRLLDNAIKFSQSKEASSREILLSAYARNGAVYLSVKDHGIGFPAHVQRQLFELFFQYNREQIEQQGSGSGLAIAKGIVDIHQGHIEAEGEPGNGSTFTIVLPAYARGMHAGVAAGERRRLASILIVEDDKHLLDGLRELLEMARGKYRFRVITAQNGKEGLLALQRQQVDLIISDVMMPVMGGFEFLEEVRAHDRWLQIPFIFLTAKGEREDIHRGRRSGAEEYITKPYDVDELIELTTTQLDRHFQRQGAVSESFEALKRGILDMLQPEFRDPLNLVTDYARKLAGDMEHAETVADMVASLQGIQASSAYLTQLVEDFIAMAEFKTGEAEAAFELRAVPVKNVSLLLYEAAYALQFDAEQDGIAFHYELDHNVAPVLCDRDRLRETFGRLTTVLLDARGNDDMQMHFLSSGGERAVRLEIRASGTNFPAERASEIASFLADAKESVLDLPDYGPRLTVAKQSIQIHYGTLTLRQEGEGQVAFVVTLPTRQSVDSNGSN